MPAMNGVKTRQATEGQKSWTAPTESKTSKQISRTKSAKRSPVQPEEDHASDKDQHSDSEDEFDGQLPDGEVDVGDEEKDEAELELERLVFGDSKGFMDNIHAFGRSDGADTVMHEGSSDDDDEEDMAGMRDQDLFFMDTTGSGAMPIDLGTTAGDHLSDDENTLTGRKAAWVDSDDERITVSLANAPRLRKLRVTADEDVVNGKEYIKRLRKQFVLLNPTPDWAVEARQQPPTKRRRLSREGEDSDSEMDSAGEDDDEHETLSARPLADLLRNARGLVRSRNSTKVRKLRPETLDIQRVRDVGTTQPSSVDSISFHPELPLLLTSGASGTLYLHHIIPSPPAPEANPLLTSLHLRNTPLTTTVFHPNDSRIFLSARRRYFHVWDLASGKVEKITRVYGQAAEQKSMETLKISPCGRWAALKGTSRKGGGVINVLSAKTLQWQSQLRIDSGHGVADFAWWRSGDGLTVAGKNGEITEWDAISETVKGRWSDAGAVGTTVIALGGKLGIEGAAASIGNDRWVAVGSSSGIVNIYDRGVWYREHDKSTTSPCPPAPVPTRVLDHLTTPISALEFSPDSQLLAMASRWKRDAFRLVHLPSCTVYKNWPTAATPLGRVTGVAFSIASSQPQGGEEGLIRMAVGTEAGKVRMWEIRP